MKIPKLIHQIWLGDAMPPLMRRWRRAWRDLHPSWTLLSWTEQVCSGELHLHTEEAVALGLCSRPVVIPTREQADMLDRACNLAQHANIWRYILMLQHGGLYIDTDVEPFRPVDVLLENCHAFAAERRNFFPPMYENAFFGAAPGDPWIRDLVYWLSFKDPGRARSMGVELFTEVLRKHPEVAHMPTDKIVFEPPESWAATQPDPEPGQALKSFPEAHVVHHWGALWHKKGFIPLHKELP